MTEINAASQTTKVAAEATTIANETNADMAAGTSTMPTAATTTAANPANTTKTTAAASRATFRSMPRTRTLRRAPEMDADIDDVDVAAVVGVDVKVVDDNVIKNDDDNEDSIDSITQELVNSTKPVAKEATAVEVDQAALPMTEQNLDNSKPFKIKDVTRHIRKAMVASTLAELRLKVAVRFERGQPAIHLDCDGTEIDDEEYFSTLEPNAELIAVFPGEQWRDPSDYNANVRRSSLDARRLRKLVNQLQLQQNMLNDADLDTLSNMDPNSLVDITGRDLKDSDYEAARRSTELSC